PFAASTLVQVPSSDHSDETMRSLLTLSDVMCTGHHAAVSAGIRPGSVVAVVGDGAVGLCAIIASCRLGAARVVALSRNPARQQLARFFGATDILAERGDEAIVGPVGAPAGGEVPIDSVIFRNIGLRGGVAPARRYIPELLDDVLEGRIHPGRVFDFETNVDGIAEAYAAMDERRAIKSLVTV